MPFVLSFVATLALAGLLIAGVLLAFKGTLTPLLLGVAAFVGMLGWYGCRGR